MQYVRLYDSRNRWLEQLEQAPVIDAVITNSIGNWMNGHIWEDVKAWARTLVLLQMRDAPWIEYVGLDMAPKDSADYRMQNGLLA